MIKIISLNLCNYHNFKERMPRIIDFIKRANPDVIALQEVRDDAKFNKDGENQAVQLNMHLRYPYISFVETMDVNKVKNAHSGTKCIEGLAFLSKLPVLETVKKSLKKQPNDKFTRAVMHIKVMSNKPVDILNVHFSPGINFAVLHLKEALEFSRDLGIDPIIVGDFNIPSSEIIKEAAHGYHISTDAKKYLSYCPKENIKKDKVYNPEPCTLDYILIPKNCKFKYFDCIGEDLSDHSALIAEIMP